MIRNVPKCHICVSAFQAHWYESQSRVSCQHSVYTWFTMNYRYILYWQFMTGPYQVDKKGPKGSWRHHNACMYLCTYVKRCKTPKVPGRLEALSHWQWSSVIILLPRDKLKTKLPQIHVQFFLGISEITFEFCTSHLNHSRKKPP